MDQQAASGAQLGVAAAASDSAPALQLGEFGLPLREHGPG
jgi:hypothetical protein